LCNGDKFKSFTELRDKVLEVERAVCVCSYMLGDLGQLIKIIATKVSVTLQIRIHYFTQRPRVIYLAPVIRLVAANRRITVRARSAIDWGLYTEGKRSAATERLGLGSG